MFSFWTTGSGELFIGKTWKDKKGSGYVFQCFVLRFLWSILGPHRGLQAQRCRRLLLPVRLTVGCAAHHAKPQDWQVTFRLRLIDMPRPIHRQRYGPGAEPG